MAANQLFEIGSFLQIGSATLAVTVCATIARQLRPGWNSPWVPFLAACFVSVIGAGISGAYLQLTFANPSSVEFWTSVGRIAAVFLNAGLLFCGALGLNDLGKALTTPTPAPELQENAALARPPLFAPWFRALR